MLSSIPSFVGNTILIVGDVMLDRYWLGETERLSPEAPVPIVSVTATDHRPGGAGNVACNLATLGVNTILLGVTGDDEAAEILNQQFEHIGITADLLRIATLSTIIKLRVVSHHQQLVRLDFEASLTGYDEQQLLARYQQYLPRAQLVILSDYHKGTILHPELFIQLAKAQHIPVVIDPKGHDFNCYGHATIVTPNHKEFEAVVGSCHTDEVMITKAQQLRSVCSWDAVLITRSDKGMHLIQEHSSTHFPAHAHEVFDVTGAGDTVVAALAASVVAGLPLASATALANLAASIVVSKFGAATVTPLELQAALLSQHLATTSLVDEKKLSTIIKQAKQQNKRIIFTNGCFDIVHAGHVNYLQAAKQLGDVLIVAINTDESVRRLKGATRPINPLAQRALVLASLSVVDWVIPFVEDTPEQLLNLLQPDILVKGGDYTIEQVVGAEIVLAYGGKVQVIPSAVNTSSTAILKHLNHVE